MRHAEISRYSHVRLIRRAVRRSRIVDRGVAGEERDDMIFHTLEFASRQVT